MIVPGLIIALIINYGTPDGQRVRLQEDMPSIDVCWQTARELMDAAGPDLLKYGINITCFMKFAGEPS